MTYCAIDRKTTITVADHKALLTTWRRHSFEERILIAAYRSEKALTESQLRRLPKSLRRMLRPPTGSTELGIPKAISEMLKAGASKRRHRSVAQAAELS